MRLIITISEQPNGMYRACCPELPGCVVRGHSRDEAGSMIRLAVEGYLSSLNVALPHDLDGGLVAETAEDSQ